MERKQFKTTGEWGSTPSAPRPALQDHSSTQGKKCQASFAVAHSGRLPLPTYLPGLSRPELRKPLLPRLKWKGARLPDGTHRGGPSQRLGGEARQPALRSPGAPSGGGRGGGGKQGRTRTSKAKAGHRTKRSEGRGRPSGRGRWRSRARTSKAKAKRRTERSEGRGRPSGRGRRQSTPRQHRSTKRRTRNGHRQKTPRGAEPQARLCRAMPRGGSLP